MAEDIKQVTIERMAGGFVVEGYYLGAGDSWGTPWPLRFKEVAKTPDELMDVLRRWDASWKPQEVETNG